MFLKLFFQKPVFQNELVKHLIQMDPKSFCSLVTLHVFILRNAIYSIFLQYFQGCYWLLVVYKIVISVVGLN